MNFEQRLNQLIDNFTGEIIEAVRQSSLRELMELGSPSAAPEAETGTIAKASSQKRRPGRPRKTAPALSAATEQPSSPASEEAVHQPDSEKGAVQETPASSPPASAPAVKAEPTPAPTSEEATLKPQSLPQTAPQPIPFYKQAEKDRFEKAVMEFVTLNPGTDAGQLSMRLGVPLTKAQTTLDEFAFSGRLKMTSGSHGRQYRVNDGE